jgi:hypothetical protein
MYGISRRSSSSFLLIFGLLTTCVEHACPEIKSRQRSNFNNGEEEDILRWRDIRQVKVFGDRQSNVNVCLWICLKER